MWKFEQGRLLGVYREMTVKSVGRSVDARPVFVELYSFEHAIDQKGLWAVQKSDLQNAQSVQRKRGASKGTVHKDAKGFCYLRLG